ncbi:hypothetical protein T492DRAFT_926463 [Pavlovales sp. CCMP2436]|nr:hypothetical protein T492DRAFT_926463 [Pavlovales sp. CCMP2436]|mmetsp:Transcript_18341/g.46911  ORF Transcript_18341/g.46911 Transcript_18341/m.46911 type:complete len:169 (+) Transcript_18341:217-723(+)
MEAVALHSALTPAQVAGLSSIGEAHGYDDVHATLTKILGNIMWSPAEAKFRRLRTSNEKVRALLSVRGARQLLLGCGFVQEVDALVLPEACAIGPVVAAATGLRVQLERREDELMRQRSEAIAILRDTAMQERRAKEPARGVAQAQASHILLKATDEAAVERLAAWKL